MSKKLHIKTWGCQMNEYDSSKMADLLDASNGIGAAVKRREDTHRMAEANRAFSHFKW